MIIEGNGQYGTCGRCGESWKTAKPHSTQFDQFRGCFPLCQPCWSDLATPDARLPFYESLVAMWRTMGPIPDADHAAIVAAVMAGA